MAISGSFYRVFGRRFSTLLLFSVGGAFFLEGYLNRFTTLIWDYHNYGKQWKDIKHRYVEQSNEE